MILKYNLEIEKEEIVQDLDRITNLVFKLLPSREEGLDWEIPLQNLMLEVVGMNRLFCGQPSYLPLLSKMESLFTLTNDEDFILFRKTIFECLNILKGLKECL